jgi:putative spermidine/putrescine transport system substrate-binding protein
MRNARTWRAGFSALAFCTATITFSDATRADDLTIALFGGRLGDLMKETLVKPFADETKLKAVADDRDWGIGVVRTRVEGGSNTWDVVNAEDVEVAQGCAEGLFVPLDKTRIPNIEKFVQGIDTSGCGLPMVLYNNAIAYNRDKVSGEPKNWADFWNVAKWPGKRSLYKSPRDSLEAALMADGVAPDQVYKVLSTPEGVDRAFKKLDELKPNLLWWAYAGQARQQVASGEVVMTSTYDGPVHFMNQSEKTNVGVVLTNAMTHTDYWAIVDGTKHADNAYKFLDYSAGAEPQSKWEAQMLNPAPNRDALAMIPVDAQKIVSGTLDQLENAPADRRPLASDTVFWLDHYDELSKRFEAWSSSK